MQFILVTYDIADDRRRARLHNALLNYGAPVQYSVFECTLDDAGERAMRAAVARIVRPRRRDNPDSVRFYYLCAGCLRRVATLGPPDTPGELPDVVVI